MKLLENVSLAQERLHRPFARSNHPVLRKLSLNELIYELSVLSKFIYKPDADLAVNSRGFC
jgi:hypothetical protein